MLHRLAVASLAGVCLAAPASAALPSARELVELSLEQLANLEVTSVSRRPESLAEAPASIFVITAEEIRRAGAVSLPEALRLAPNLQVSQASNNGWSVRARGVANTSANKLLVMIDGRSVYSPLFSGVFWDVQEVMLEDVERIEVLSGPGGTLWGVNAVNGVINVITREASATQGALATAGAGSLLSRQAVRYGARAGDHAHYRFFVKHIDRRHTETASGEAVDDRAHLALAGMRFDWHEGRDRVGVNANAYRGTMGQPKPGSISISGVDLALGPIPVEGANITGRWSRALGSGSELALQAYVDHTERTVPPTFAEKLTLVDMQLQHSWRLGEAEDIVWGAQYRRGRDRLVNGAIVAFLPARLSQQWTSLFAQGESRLGASLRLTAGARLERNDYTGNEVLPNVRLSWKPVADHLLWAAASRTVRAPSRLDRDVFVPATAPFLLAGGPDVRSEVAQVFELGARGQVTPRFSYAATVFHSEYDHLRTQEIDPGMTFLVFASQMEATTYGIELWASWQATDKWRLSAGYFAQHENFRLKPGSNDVQAVGLAGRDPAYTWLVRSSYTFNLPVELDATVRGVASLSNPTVPAYVTADLRLGWRPLPGVQLSLLAANLGDGGHGEVTAIETRTEIGRSFHASVRWDFDAR
ncbi:MAG TPA: TonB-dependent receptor [Usitatibacter sp.]|nr:TonB-dependent receptor [Usitatibacter sp.]